LGISGNLDNFIKSIRGGNNINIDTGFCLFLISLIKTDGGNFAPTDIGKS